MGGAHEVGPKAIDLGVVGAFASTVYSHIYPVRALLRRLLFAGSILFLTVLHSFDIDSKMAKQDSMMVIDDDEGQQPLIMPGPHPLDQLSSDEVSRASGVVLSARRALLQFRAIFLEEPSKVELAPYLEAEHRGTLTIKSQRPARLARLHYDVINDDRTHDYTESVVDVSAGKEVLHRIVHKKHQPALTTYVDQEFPPTLC